MLTPTTKSIKGFVDLLPPAGPYFLKDVRLDIPNPSTAIYKATLMGPTGAKAWARAWLANDAGTLAETASPCQTAGDNITLEVILPSQETPQSAFMRIESAPLKTQHVVVFKLSSGQPKEKSDGLG